MHWTKLESNLGAIYRCKIEGGWLVQAYTVTAGTGPLKSISITFLPDPEHKWNGKSID